MVDTTQNEAAVKDVVNSFVAAWNVHDVQAFSRTFAPDADFTNVFGMHVRGRDAIEQLHAPIFRTIFKDSHLVATETRVRFLRPDIASVDVIWKMTGARDPKGNDWPDRLGLLSLMVASEGGAWSIAVMHNMDLDSEEMAEAQARLQ